MARLRRALCLALSLGAAACAAPAPSIDPPDITIAGLTLGQSGPFENRLWVDLRLANPNDVEIGIARLEFDLEIDRRRLASGGLVGAVDLPASDEVYVPVLMTIAASDLVAAMMELGDEQQLAYRLAGEVEIGHVVTRTVPFERSGRLELARTADGEAAAL